MKQPRKTSTSTIRIASLVLATFLLLLGRALGTKPGDVAKGKILSDDGTRLVLDTQPCKNPATKTVTFKKPFRKRSSTPTKCGDSGPTYDEVQVEQLASDPPAENENGKNKDKEKDKPDKDKLDKDASPPNGNDQ